MCSAVAPSRLLIRPASAADTKPARGNSFRLIVNVSIGGRHFHGAVTPRHFYVAVASARPAVDVASFDSVASLACSRSHARPSGASLRRLLSPARGLASEWILTILPYLLARRWRSEYPNLFDDQDLRLASGRQTLMHFKEWFAAVHLFHSRGALSLVEKYRRGKAHLRKRSTFERLLTPDQRQLLNRICRRCHV